MAGNKKKDSGWKPSTDHLKPYQYKKGQSGNPKGRPKDHPNYITTIELRNKVTSILRTPVSINPDTGKHQVDTPDNLITEFKDVLLIEAMKNRGFTNDMLTTFCIATGKDLRKMFTDNTKPEEDDTVIDLSKLSDRELKQIKRIQDKHAIKEE